MKARPAPAITAGRNSGNTICTTVLNAPAPRLAAASSRRGSSWRIPAKIERPVRGSERTRYARGRIQSVPTSTNRPIQGALTLIAAARARANTVPGIAQGRVIIASSARPGRPPRRSDNRAAATPTTTAARVAAAAIHSELRAGRSRSTEDSRSP